MFGQLENLLHDILYGIHDNVGLSWAWSIVALTALVRIAILPVTVKQTRSMLAMIRLQPYVKQLQQKYKGDKQELQIRLMEFYKDNKVNPLASCLPMLLQMPVFIGLFYMLRNFTKHAHPKDTDYSWIFGFIHDIRVNINDAGWQGWTLLTFYVISQIFAGRVMATSPDPKQRMIAMIMPLAFVPFIVNFPVGLMIYWITTNLWTLGQHLVVVRLTSVTGEIIMPEDTKGRKRTVVPKADKAAARSGRGERPDAGGAALPSTARRNKRRR